MPNLVLVFAVVGSLLVTTLVGASAQTTTAENVANARPGDVRLMITDGLKAPMTRVRANIEKELGRHLVLEFSESHVLQRRMDTGQPFEVALVTQDVVEQEIAKGNMRADHSVVARIHVGFFQRGGEASLDVSTPEAVKRTLLGAKSIRWAENAAAEPTALNVLQRLGIENEVRSRIQKTVMGHPSQDVPLAPGEYEIIINIIGGGNRFPYRYLGDVPGDLEVPIVLMAGIGAKGDVAAAESIMKFLASPAYDVALKGSGLTR